MIKKPLHVLIIDDSEEDSLLIIHELKKSGYKVTSDRVDTGQAMEKALDNKSWDVIIADHSMPKFNGLEALSLMQKKGADIPFIMVSGKFGEDFAVEAMKAGVHDYILKDKLMRLVPAVERELKEATMRHTHRLAQRALQESEERYRLIFEAAARLIISINEEGVIVDCNSRISKLLGFTVPEVIGLSMPSLFQSGALGDTENWLKTVLADQVIEDQEYKMVRKDGKVIDVSINFSSARNVHGVHTLIICVIEDITERKKAERLTHKANEELELRVEERTRELKAAQEKLMRSERLAALGKLAGVVSHELRNPLGVMRNSVYFLAQILKDFNEDAKVKKYLGILEEEISIADKIITDTLSFGRLKKPDLQKNDINDMIRWALEKSQVPARISVTLDLGDNIPPVLSDRLQIFEVFCNIIQNAVQAIAKRGTIEITSRAMSDRAEVRFSDTGVGIPPENMDKIFDPLFSTKAKGTGLGLSLCQNIVDAHGGTIQADRSVTKGAAFIITLPL